MKFTKDGGAVTFEARFLPGADPKYLMARYCVKDTGIGEDFLAHLFDDFAQEESQYKGSGLGLAISKHYVDMMGGVISVTSSKGKGSEFTVELPLEAADAPAAHEVPVTSARNLAGIRVLLAEDNDLNAEIAQLQLEKSGLKVTRVADGREAVERYRCEGGGAFDVILMDIMMPRMTGCEAAKAIRALPGRPDAAKIPIIDMIG